jgi:hypothetical protein
MNEGIQRQVQDVLEQVPYSEYGAIVIGLVLIVAGRKLYWLSTGGMGFVLGVLLAGRAVAGASFLVELGIALLAGVVGAVFAIVAQQAAVVLTGMLVGAGLAFMVALPFAEDLGATLYWMPVMGAVFGVVFAAFVFETALSVVTAVVGAFLVVVGLVVAGVEIREPYDLVALAALSTVGVGVQSRLGKRRRYYETGADA